MKRLGPKRKRKKDLLELNEKLSKKKRDKRKEKRLHCWLNQKLLKLKAVPRSLVRRLP